MPVRFMPSIMLLTTEIYPKTKGKQVRQVKFLSLSTVFANTAVTFLNRFAGQRITQN